MRTFIKKNLPVFLAQWVMVVFLLGLSTLSTAADTELLASSTPKEVEKLQKIFPDKTFNATQTQYQEFFVDSARTRNISDDNIRFLFVYGFCESAWRQYNNKGQVLSGYIHPPDKGIFQLNTAVHNFKWETYQENILSALELFLRDGLRPWSPSKKCLNKWLSKN